MDNYEQQKTKILTDFFNSGILNIKADGYFKGRLQISRYTHIAEELVLQTYLELCKQDAETLVKRYQENPKSLEAISVVIMKRQLMHKKRKVSTGETGTSKFIKSDYQPPLSPNNSFGTKLIFGSSFFSNDFVSHTDHYNEAGESGDYQGIPIAEDQDGNYFKDRDYSPDRFEAIKARLTTEEIEFVTDLWNGKKFYKRKPTNQYKEFRDYVFNKIKNMDLNKEPTPIEQIRNKLSMDDVLKFEVMFDEDLTMAEKLIKLKFSKQQYLSQRRMLLKKIKALNIK